jgi:serine-type D-Ala-D-Ala endopeptidase (penicillin-binding protein 7)
MRSASNPSNVSRKKDVTLAVLVAILAATAGLAPLAWYYTHRQDEQQVATATAPAPAPTAEAEAVPPAPPGTEVVPPEESETDRGPASASPAGPTLSFARAAGLHLAPDPLHLNSSAALLVDQESGETLVRKNDEAVLPIASLTKLMTALLVAEAKQPMDEVLSITEEDVDNERHSRSRLKVGTKLTRQEALRLALMSSENRAAHALGRSYPGGIPKLVATMNAKAKELGMRNTTYADPTGLSNRNQSTARDLAVLVSAVAKNPMLAEFSTTPAHLAALGGRTLQYNNSNRLVRNRKAGWDIELQKTGYIVEAGRCLTMLHKVAGHNLVMVLLDADSNGQRLADAERMRRWLVAQWGVHETVAKSEPEKAVRKVSAKKKKKDEAGKRKAVAAKKDEGKTKVAGKKTTSKTKVARKSDSSKADDDKAGRVRQTFATGKDDEKS